MFLLIISIIHTIIWLAGFIACIVCIPLFVMGIIKLVKAPQQKDTALRSTMFKKGLVYLLGPIIIIILSLLTSVGLNTLNL
jgi:surface polysaccharide O-acyltransferase-like enzyme